jgi:threo-3-hydroxy-L-aspartate ammonia-lyase
MASAADRWTEGSGVARPSPTITLDDMRAAARGLEGVAVRTPLLHSPELTRAVGVPVAIKCEHLQPVGAFKIRGAYTAVSRIPAERRARGVITYSSGNHGQAVAFAARLLGIPAVVVMPERAPAIKVDGVRRLGGEVIIAGNSSAERYGRARAMAEERGLAMIPPYESVDVIAGQGTCGLEILEDWPVVEEILVPVGGGGLIAGISAAAAALKPGVRIHGVEPVGAPKLSRALQAGQPVELDHTESLADGLLPLAIGRLPFAVLSGVVRDAVLVSEDEIANAVRYLFRELQLSPEPSGAVTTAALLSGRVRPAGPAVAVLSGGNIDPHLLQRLVAPSAGSRQAPGSPE